MPWAGGGGGVNSDPNAPYVTPDTILIHITFSSPLYLMSQINIENFNPFIITNQRRGYEVHLPDYPPTDLADQSVLGTFEDRSNPSTGKYYLTENNLPWAINIYENFAYPKATIDIINAYNHFVEWATSGGVVYPDWYMDKPGYRNNSNIYMHP
jgi:LruC domain-containing protein